MKQGACFGRGTSAFMSSFFFFFFVMSGGWELLCQDKRHKNPLLDIYGEIPVVCIFPDLGQSPTGTGVLGSVCCRAVSRLRQQHPLAAMWATKASHCCTPQEQRMRAGCVKHTDHLSQPRSSCLTALCL